MPCKSRLGRLEFARMSLVQVQQFSLSTAVEQTRPVVYEEARLKEIAKALCASPCADFLVPSEISLTKQNDLYSYGLSVPLFNGAASILVNSQGLTVAFKQGTTKEHLELMIRLTLTALDIAKVQEVKRSVLTFNTHAVFESPSEYAEHMKRFTSLSEGVISGGVVLVVALADLKGELRYASEKSLAYPDGLFLAANAFVGTGVTKELYDYLGVQFERVASVDGLTFRKS